VDAHAGRVSVEVTRDDRASGQHRRSRGLVGHSYGGAVITNVKARAPKVKALVYVAAFAPAKGESAAALAARYPGSTPGETLAPLPLPDGSNDLYIKRALFRQQFAADVSARQAALMAATQRPIRDTALDEASGEPSWAVFPHGSCWPAPTRTSPRRRRSSWPTAPAHAPP
jgi:pimeloyl-ACP methyl ester carboxylesterase